MLLSGIQLSKIGQNPDSRKTTAEMAGEDA